MSDPKKFMNNPVLDAETEIIKMVGSAGYRFAKKVTLTSAAAATKVDIITADQVAKLCAALGLSGLIIENLEMMQEAGVSLKIDNLILEVVSVKNNRIYKVKISKSAS